jgi:hypothetical protein
MLDNMCWFYIESYRDSLVAFNRIGGVMVSILASSATDRGFEARYGQTRLWNWYLLLLHKARSTKEKEQILFGSESD